MTTGPGHTEETPPATAATGRSGDDELTLDAALPGAACRALLESVSEMVFICEHDEACVPRTFVEVNAFACETLGYSREELLGLSPLDTLLPEVHGLLARDGPGLARSGELKLERDVVSKSGRTIPMRLAMRVFESGGVCFSVVIAREIADPGQAEAPIEVDASRTHRFLDISGAMLVALDRDGNVGTLNAKAAEVLGYREDELIGRNWFDVCIRAQERKQAKGVFLKLMAGDLEPVRYQENVVITRTGDERTILWHNTTVNDVSGNAVGTLASGLDVTARRQAEDALRKSEERHRALYDNAPIAYQSLDADGRFLDVNPAWLRTLGYDRDEVIGSRYAGLLHPDSREIFEREFSEFKKRGHLQVTERRIRHKDGHYLCVSLHASCGRWPNGDFRQSYGVFEDITDRKAAEEALRASEQSLREALAEISHLKELLEAENLCLREEIRGSGAHGPVVTDGAAMRAVMHQAARVGHTTSTVLITGETGTGKELLARAIHDMSPRRGRPLVVVNCAAIPETLVESELFGREKGAYTGATTKQIGRFEVADGSTMFLDEIGELPLGTQAKLLRVLEQGQIERLGSTRTMDVDVRVIVATNSDLERAVQDGSFRRDLFYRLNVFPLHVPPLRDRVEDIPALVDLFVEQFSTRMGMRAGQVTEACMDALMRYSWPGNIRELRNLVERAMIRGRGPELRIELPEGHLAAEQEAAGPVKLDDVEREHIVSVLKSTGWRVRGRRGAAELLGLKPSTLESRMKKLGIRRPV